MLIEVSEIPENIFHANAPHENSLSYYNGMNQEQPLSFGQRRDGSILRCVKVFLILLQDKFANVVLNTISHLPSLVTSSPGCSILLTKCMESLSLPPRNFQTYSLAKLSYFCYSVWNFFLLSM